VKRRFESIFLAILLAFSFIFAACGKKEEQQEAPPPPPPASTAPQPSEQAAPATGDQNAGPAQPAPGETPAPEKKGDAAKAE
jgi:hypothetical protein